jgi:hypothetical protein
MAAVSNRENSNFAAICPDFHVFFPRESRFRIDGLIYCCQLELKNL